MLRLDLARLAREGSVVVEGRIPPDDALWEGSGLEFAAPVEVRLRASWAGSGELVVRGTIGAPVQAECRRCLDPVRVDLDEEVTMVFASPETPGIEEDAETRKLDPRAGELDLSGPVREEVILAADPYVLCDPGCKGLCPRCGVNKNEETCTCVDEERDPRWDALEALKKR